MKGPLAGLMQQAQRMQEDMKRAQEEIAQMEVTGQSGGGLVSVRMSGRHEVRGVTIDRKLFATIRRWRKISSPPRSTTRSTGSPR